MVSDGLQEFGEVVNIFNWIYCYFEKKLEFYQ